MIEEENLTNYRGQLQLGFNQRMEKNKSYSLRAFARDLALDPGQLSLILKGKKNLSLSKASEVAKKLYKTPREMILFYHAVEWQLVDKDEVKKQIFKRLQNINAIKIDSNANISDDEFNSISNWYNIPMIELASLPDFEMTIESAAKYLGISISEATIGLAILQRLNFVEKKDKIFSRIRSLSTTTEISSYAIKQFHSQMIGKAKNALFRQNLSTRYFNSVTLVVPKGKVNELKKMIDEHEKRILEFSKTFRNEPDQDVYQVSNMFFSLKDQDNVH